jgi:hypothetical protein
LWHVGENAINARVDASLTQGKWDAMFERLFEFKQTNGYANVKPQGVFRQRTMAGKGQLDPRQSWRMLATRTMTF